MIEPMRWQLWTPVAGLVLAAGLLYMRLAPAPAPATPTPAVTATAPAPAPSPAPTTGPAATRPDHSPATPQDIPGVGNFAQVSAALYRGEQPTAEGFAELKRRGIRTIVSLRAFNSDRDELKGLGLRYIRIGSHAWNPEREDILEFLRVVRDPANQPVFVHCQHGADRTGCAVAAYRMVEQGWTVDEALAELPNFGFHEIWKSARPFLRDLDIESLRRDLEKPAPAPKIDTVP